MHNFILHQINHIQKIINQCQISNTNPVTLLAVSKGQPAEKIAQAFSAGIHQFGESYWQEAQKKQQALAHLPIIWHFIGHIQKNKAKAIAQNFHWVQSVASFEIAERLSQARAQMQPPQPDLNICIQINIDQEESKSGIPPNELPNLIQKISTLPHLKFRGIMAIPSPESDKKCQRQTFDKLYQLFTHITVPCDTLSMGMSADYPEAIAAGSTMIRIGRNLFGERVKEDI